MRINGINRHVSKKKPNFEETMIATEILRGAVYLEFAGMAEQRTGGEARERSENERGGLFDDKKKRAAIFI